MSRTEIARRYRERNPLKVKARRKVYIELRAGRLKKQPCEKCGAKKVEAHHPDYNKPLDIQWLCYYHHSLAEIDPAKLAAVEKQLAAIKPLIWW